MAWTTPKTWVSDEVPGESDLNTHIRDNEQYLQSGRPKFSIFRDNGADYMTTSATFVDVDGTNLKATLTLAGSAVLLGFNCVCKGNGVSQASFDFAVDGVRLGVLGNDGLGRGAGGAAGVWGPICIFALAPDLSVGSHIFKVQWKRAEASGTPQMFAGSGESLEDYIPHFWGIEVA